MELKFLYCADIMMMMVIIILNIHPSPVNKNIVRKTIESMQYIEWVESAESVGILPGMSSYLV